MPYPLGAECWMNLFNLTQLFGLIQNEAFAHDNVDTDAIRSMGYDLLHLHDEGGCDRVLLNQCAAEASRAITAFGEVLADAEAPADMNARVDMMEKIGVGLRDFLSCIVDQTELGVQIIQEQPFVGWPGDDENWLQVVKPKPNRRVRR